MDVAHTVGFVVNYDKLSVLYKREINRALHDYPEIGVNIVVPVKDH